MSSTSKARLQALLPRIDDLFATAHPADVKDLAAELREVIALKVSGARRGQYDTHTNDATNDA